MDSVTTEVKHLDMKSDEVPSIKRYTNRRDKFLPVVAMVKASSVPAQSEELKLEDDKKFVMEP